jgi:hypothetical protein
MSLTLSLYSFVLWNVRACNSTFRLLVGTVIKYSLYKILLAFYKSTTTYLYIRSVLLVEETRVPGENHQPIASH